MPDGRVMVVREKKKPHSKIDREQRCGRVWLWIAFDPISKLAVNYRVDNQTLDACRAFFKDLTRRLTNIPLFTSDELGHYMVVLFETYRISPEIGWDYLPFSERFRVVNRELDYGIFHKERRNGRVVGTKQIVFYGDEKRVFDRIKNSPSKKINTAFIERFNGTLRLLCANLHRKSQCFSKDFKYFGYRIAIAMAYYNFVRPHGTLSKIKGESYKPTTPAMAKGITDRVLDIKELLGLPLITTIA